jgi:hypothetical protein
MRRSSSGSGERGLREAVRGRRADFGVVSEMPVPQLRPLGIGEILDVGIKITMRHWWTLARAVLVVVVPLQLVAAIVDVSASGGVVTSTGDPATIEEDEVWTFVAAALVALTLTLLAQTIATGACFKAVADAYLGNVPSWKRSLAEVLRRLHSIIWVSILAFVLGALGLIACIAPGIWLYISWTVAVPALLTEGVTGRRALGRSFRLVRGFWWRTFAIIILGSVLAGILEAALGGVLGAVSFATSSDVVDVVTSLLSAVVAGAITVPFVAAVTIVLYVDLRVRKEGFDLALLVQRFGEPGAGAPVVPPAPPPYVPPPRPTFTGSQPPYWPPPPGWKPEDEG